MLHRSVAATPAERARQLPGDSLIADAAGQLTHAITIQRPPAAVWPWLVQMGAGSRGGWYSYDRLDNGGRPSASRINPRLQHVVVGTFFPALPGREDGFTVLKVEADAHLVLGWQAPDGAPITTWAFVLESRGDGTRLIVRSRANQRYRFLGLPPRLGFPLIRFVHFIMQRRQLLGIAQRVEESDTLLDRFMPVYDVAERHLVRVGASADVTLDAARHVDMRASPLIRAIIGLRALAMGDTKDTSDRPRGLLAETTSMGWCVLAEVPGREVIVGAAARPWLKDVTFRPIAPADFAAFAEPGLVKIVWTLRIDSEWPDGVVFGTETRAIATDAGSRARFLRYWRRVVPGVVAIRWILLRLLKKEAEGNRLESLAHGRSH